MPNWSPSEDHVDRLIRTVNMLTNRRATMMEADYPLNLEQVKAVVYPPMMMEFIHLGFDSMSTTHHIVYELGPEQGLARRSITQVNLPVAIHYAYRRQLHSNYMEKIPNYFNRDGIDDVLMDKLKQWTERAVYERRLAALVNDTVVEFFKKSTTGPLTMYHILSRWPAIKVVFSHTKDHYYRGADMWEKHSNEAPMNLQRWGWPYYGPEAEWRYKYRKRMLLAEETLLSCVQIPVPKDDSSRRLTAKLADWQKLNGMPF